MSFFYTFFSITALALNHWYSFISSFTQEGHTVYVPEIIGRSFYDTEGMDANEYEKSYQKDIQCVVNHMKETNPEKMYAIAHSLGCSQLLHSLAHQAHEFKDVSAIAGAWDAGANRYSAMKKINQTPEGLWNVMNSRRSFLGEYAIKKEDQKNITETYNPIVSEDLNQLFSVFYHSDNIPFDLPIQFIHAKDDSAVAFSLSVDMFEALRSQDKPVSAYFISSGGHGFIKNPIATDTTQQDLYPKQRLEIASRILTFFDNSKKETGKIYFDRMPETIENLKANDYKDVRIDHALFLATQKSAK